MKKNKLAQRLHSIFADMFDWTKHPDGTMYYNPYQVKWKRGRPSKEAYELREWVAGWDLYFYEAYPHLKPRDPFMAFLGSLGGNEIKPIKKGKQARTVLVKYHQRYSSTQ